MNFVCRSLAVLLFCGLSQAVLLAADAVAVTVVTVEGDEHPGKLRDILENAFIFENSQMAQKDVAELRFAVPGTAANLPLIVLRNDDRLRAAVLSGDDTRFKLKNAALGEFELENKFVSAIVFPLKDGPSPDAVDSFLKTAPPKEDQLLLPKGDTLSGFMEKFTETDLFFNAGGQSRPYAFDRIAVFRMAPLEAYKSQAGFRATVILRDGSSLTGKLTGMQERAIVLEVLNGAAWRIPAASLQSIQMVGGKLVYLSDLSPQSAEEKPFVSGLPVVYRWRKNQSAAGESLTLGTRVYPRGIGMHSYTRLAYNLNGQFARFISDVGLDAQAMPAAACSFQVLVDGKAVAGGNLKATEKQAVQADLTAAQKLELICDFGPDEDDSGDLLDWANARLIRP